MIRALAVAAALILAACSPAAPRGRPERIVLVVVDMLRPDRLGCYGGGAPTPAIDRLAREGVRFPQVVSAFHQTTMSMAALFTGRTPSLESGDPRRPLDWNGRTWCGMARFAAPGDDACIPASLPTLAEGMREAGYATIGIASNPLLFDPSGYRQGFDEWVEVGDVVPTLQIGRPVALSRAAGPVHEAVRRALDRRRGDRFFLYVHYMDVHDFGTMGVSYDDGVRAADGAVSALVDELGRLGLLERTTIVLTSDHGERLGEKHALPGMPSHFGNPSFETLLRVPLVVWPRSGDPPPTTFRGQDTGLLIRRLAGLEAAPAADLEPDEVLVTEKLFLSYRRYPWKSMWRRADDRLHLFNLEDDPGELRDLAVERETVARAHRERIARLAADLGVGSAPEPGLSESDRQRLRALGYLN